MCLCRDRLVVSYCSEPQRLEVRMETLILTLSSTQPFSLLLWLLSQTLLEHKSNAGTSHWSQCFIFSHDFPTAGFRQTGGELTQMLMSTCFLSSYPSLSLSFSHTQSHLALNLFLPLSYSPSCCKAQLSTRSLVSEEACPCSNTAQCCYKLM